MTAVSTTSPESTGASLLRFETEVVAWIATPWALWAVSPWLSGLSLIVLIGLPTVFSTPGDKNHVIVPVSGPVTIGLVLLQGVAAVVSSWLVWPWPVAATVTVLAIAMAVTEQPRWRWLLKERRRLA